MESGALYNYLMMSKKIIRIVYDLFMSALLD